MVQIKVDMGKKTDELYLVAFFFVFRPNLENSVCPGYTKLRTKTKH